MLTTDEFTWKINYIYDLQKKIYDLQINTLSPIYIIFV